MDKVKWNYIIDVLILIAFIIVAITGLLKWPGVGAHKFLPMLKLTMLHDLSGLIATIFAFLHVALNWNFMICMTKKYLQKNKKKCENK